MTLRELWDKTPDNQRDLPLYAEQVVHNCADYLSPFGVVDFEYTSAVTEFGSQNRHLGPGLIVRTE